VFTALNAFAVNGITANANVTTEGDMFLNADSDGDNEGMLTVGDGDEIIAMLSATAEGMDIDITAADVDIGAGSFIVAADYVSFTQSSILGDDIILGDGAPGSMYLSNDELARITADITYFITGGDIFANGVSTGAEQGLVTLFGHHIFFGADPDTLDPLAAASTFWALNAGAVNGITVNANLTTTGGDLTLDGDVFDSEGEGPDEFSGGIIFADGITLASFGNMYLRADADINLHDPDGNGLHAHGGNIFNDPNFGASDLWAMGDLTLISLNLNGVFIEDVLHYQDDGALREQVVNAINAIDDMTGGGQEDFLNDLQYEEIDPLGGAIIRIVALGDLGESIDSGEDEGSPECGSCQ